MMEELIEAFQEADALLSEADHSQWKRPPYPVDNAGGGKKATVSDPTSMVALDTKRLRLRAAVLKSERAVRETVEAVKRSNEEMRKALEEWHAV